MQPSDVQEALAAAGAAVTPALPIVMEEEELVESTSPPRKRSRAAKEAAALQLEPSSSTATSSTTSTSTAATATKRRETMAAVAREGSPVQAAPAYRSRRKTITTLGSEDPFPSLPEDQQPAESAARKPKKRYVPVKKKTSVKIDYD